MAADERLPELPTLVVEQCPGELLQGASRNILEGGTLPAYLPKHRWFAGEKGQPRLCYIVLLDEVESCCALCEVEIGELRYQLSLGFLDADQRGDSLPQLLVLARLRHGHEVGLLTDVVSLPLFAHKALAQLRAEAVIAYGDGEFQLIPATGLAEMDDIADEDVLPFSVEQSNSLIRLGERMVLKVLHRTLPGLHPEIEVGGYLTRRGYPGIAPLPGEVRRAGADGESHTLMILRGYPNNQGGTWNWTLDNLERTVRDEISAASEALEGQYDSLAELHSFAANLSVRFGEIHSVLAGESGDPAFGGRESDEASVQAWALCIAEQLREAGKRLSEPPRPLQGEAAEQARRLLKYLPVLFERLPLLARQATGGLLIRVHGDLHLGQVLMVQGDACFIDSEDEPVCSLEERRQRHSPTKDVGDMLYSFDYAAAMVLRNAQSTDSSGQADGARRKVAMRYRNGARDAFLVGYCAAAADLAYAWHGYESEGVALALACLERVAYELLYEADYRPDWLEVPFASLAELTEHLPKGRNR